MPPPVLVKVAAAGVNVMPVLVRYGCSVRTTFGLTTVELAVMSSRCLPSRYCAAVTATESGSGCTVTVVNSGSEVAPPVFVAVMVRLMVEGRIWPAGSTGAVAVKVADAGPVEVTVAPVSAGAPAWVTVKVRASAGTFGSVPVKAMLTAAPENTVTGNTWLTVGWAAALIVIVALALADPAQFDAVSVAVTGEVAPTAEKMAL